MVCEPPPRSLREISFILPLREGESRRRRQGVVHTPSRICVVDIRHHISVACCRRPTSMARDQSRLDVLQGTLDLLILRALRGGAMHGWAISERIQLISQDVLQVNQGSLYPALHRLERRHWIKAEWGVSELGRRARFYSLTAAGRKQLEREAENWGKLSEAIARVLRMA